MSAPLLRATTAGGLKGTVDRVLAWACVVLMGASVINVTWQVVTRFVLGSPSGFTDELARFLLVWLGLLGAAYAVGQRMHLAIDLLPRALDARPKARASLGVVLQGCVLAFAVGVMLYGGGNLVRLTTLLGQRSAALGVSLGAVYTVLPLAGAVIGFYALHAIGLYVAVLRGHGRGGPDPDGSSAEAFAAASRPDATPGSELPIREDDR
ncbi:TRAP transporter small permease [Rubrivirga sp. S365]|uniref:TRAP transporter small permease n=1 Tax=Rubrivirga litoralis TaxID=3075598 RepID=A0ABU3BNR3_9BACT|nr:MULTISPECIES: TRAP transporter small permease [unclassified Rubrivirga]MDT0630903.1 TRAP transporter small permease [Rubrivirga sp. F394]MDT7856546.1 TRAP transporter small permease [Rubrivirga sp. S365]